jgi:hypothetical protein
MGLVVSFLLFCKLISRNATLYIFSLRYKFANSCECFDTDSDRLANVGLLAKASVSKTYLVATLPMV